MLSILIPIAVNQYFILGRIDFWLQFW
jgi:hypothetical protein